MDDLGKACLINVHYFYFGQRKDCFIFQINKKREAECCMDM